MAGLCWGAPPPIQPYGVLDTAKVDWGSCSESKRRLDTGWRSGLPGTFVPICNRPCPHNEVRALAMRAMGPVPPEVFRPVVDDASAAVWQQLQRFSRRYDQGARSWLETAMSYSGALRKRYLVAYESLVQDGPSGFQDWTLRAFLKTEKNRSGASPIKPRLIFPRSPRYNLELASRLKPFEHWLWGRLTGRLFGLGNSRLVAKGLNQRQRANLIRRKFSEIGDAVCFEIDGKAFEAHVGPAFIAQEHRVYASAFPGDGRLRELLSKQLELKGTLSCGAKFSRPGCRASGDFNTGMGNSLIFLVECVAALRQLGVRFDLLVDGDNALVFLQRGTEGAVLRDLPVLIQQSSGHEITLERPAYRVEDVRFGGGAPVYLGDRLGWTMVREYNRVLSGVFTSHVYMREPKFARKWMVGAAMCELSLARGVPILQQFCLEALKSLGKARVSENHHRDALVMGAWFATEDNAVPVTVDARISFERAFGISPDEQLAIEAGFSGLCFGGDLEIFNPLHLSDWLDVPGVHSSWQD